jgi:hypothetical protein
MSMPRPLLNYLDKEGAPVCPTCGRPILSHDAAMRIDDCMIHARCVTEARLTEEPCEPSR